MQLTRNVLQKYFLHIIIFDIVQCKRNVFLLILRFRVCGNAFPAAMQEVQEQEEKAGVDI